MFDGKAPITKTYLLAPGESWSLNLDDAYPGPVAGVMTNAAVRVTCDRDCAVERAIYLAPLGQAGAVSIAQVPRVCVE